jgi:hypothetical protein
MVNVKLLVRWKLQQPAGTLTLGLLASVTTANQTSLLSAPDPLINCRRLSWSCVSFLEAIASRAT